SAAVVVGRSREQRDLLIVAQVRQWQPFRTRKERRAAKSAVKRQEVQDVALDGIARLSAAYNHAPVIVDQHLSQVVRDGLRKRGIGQVHVQRWSGVALTEAFRALRARMLADRISLPNDKDLQAELLRIRTRTRGGEMRVEIPRTAQSHQDRAVALAAAVWRGPPLEQV